ncbi:ACT domain-containing protein [Actinomadura luteofluorescens]|uniref:ACT domain-containing protein n=1 Tax=Actinomadura luteofluorescens TaxID=46163 RepID=UPI0036353C61
MLLRIRVRLPDRPGSLGQVARTLGAAGADVVQMAVLERDNGRAMDDFTVAWPTGADFERLAGGSARCRGWRSSGSGRPPSRRAPSRTRP